MLQPAQMKHTKIKCIAPPQTNTANRCNNNSQLLKEDELQCDKRDKWVEHLKKKAVHTANVTYNDERATAILNTTWVQQGRSMDSDDNGPVRY
eukprot:scaffold12692_cov118-Skeletonema_dohrnii-CCMP3373.AAC.1